MMTPGYFSDMKVVDERLTKLEEGYAKIIKLLDDMTKDLSKIGGKTSGEQKVSSSTRTSNRTSRRPKSGDVNIDNK